MTTTGYGFFPGGDPRDFHPDPECCSEAEMAAHKTACEAWDRGDFSLPKFGHHRLDEHAVALYAPFGIGIYTYEDDDEPPVCQRLAAGIPGEPCGVCDLCVAREHEAHEAKALERFRARQATHPTPPRGPHPARPGEE